MSNQYLSRVDVKRYLERSPDISKEEKTELLDWLKQGNNPYHNDRYAFDSDDRPLDFIAAIRAEKEYFEEQMAQRV